MKAYRPKDGAARMGTLVGSCAERYTAMTARGARGITFVFSTMVAISEVRAKVTLLRLILNTEYRLSAVSWTNNKISNARFVPSGKARNLSS